MYVIYDTKNYYAALADEEEELGIADSGTTGNFCEVDEPVINKRLDPNPIKIKQPDGTKLMPAYLCNLDIPWLPNDITEVHILPGLATKSLISIKKFVDGGCQVIFDETLCKIYFKGCLVLSGG